MFEFSDNSPQAQAWRVQQAHVDNAIEGVEKDEALAALVSQWDAEGLNDEEQIQRLIELTKPKSGSI